MGKAKRTYSLIGTVLILSLMGIGYYQFYQRTYLCTPYPFPAIQKQDSDSIISIMIIGDSWGDLASQNRMPCTLDSIMLIHGVKTRTRAKGKNGATSREIYKNLFTEKKNTHSTSLLIEGNPQYAVVFCGMNDSHGQFGKAFYAYHTSLIIQTLLHYHIKPILLELPLYDIAQQYAHYTYTKRIIYKTLSLLTDGTTDIRNIKRYRTAMEEELIKQGLYNRIKWISADSFYTENNLNDCMHLNKNGYQCLSQIIAKTILNENRQ